MYKIGEIVHIREDLVTGERYGGVIFLDRMKEMSYGKIVSISNRGCYLVEKIINGFKYSFWFSPEMINSDGFPWGLFLSDKRVAVACKSYEEAIEFCKKLNDMGMVWSSGKKYISSSEWEVYESDTAYDNGGMFGDVEYYKQNGYILIYYGDYFKSDPHIVDNLEIDKFLESFSIRK